MGQRTFEDGKTIHERPDRLPRSWTAHCPASKVRLQWRGETILSSIIRSFESSRPINRAPSFKGKTESRNGPLMAASLGFTGNGDEREIPAFCRARLDWLHSLPRLLVVRYWSSERGGQGLQDGSHTGGGVIQLP